MRSSLLLIHTFILFCSTILFPQFATAGVPTDTSPAYTNYTFNCLDAEVRENDLDFCHMIHWRGASAFNTSTYSDYYPGEKLTAAVQDMRAHDFYDSMYTENGDSPCRQAVKRLACTMFFPEYVSI